MLSETWSNTGCTLAIWKVAVLLSTACGPSEAGSQLRITCTAAGPRAVSSGIWMNAVVSFTLSTGARTWLTSTQIPPTFVARLPSASTEPAVSGPATKNPVPLTTAIPPGAPVVRGAVDSPSDVTPPSEITGAAGVAGLGCNTF